MKTKLLKRIRKRYLFQTKHEYPLGWTTTVYDRKRCEIRHYFMEEQPIRCALEEIAKGMYLQYLIKSNAKKRRENKFKSVINKIQ